MQRRDFLKVTLAGPALGDFPPKGRRIHGQGKRPRVWLSSSRSTDLRSAWKWMRVPRCWIPCDIGSV